MKKNSNVVDPSFLSPVRGSTKHKLTPQRTRQKTSRKDREIDVHTSTPNRLQSDNPHSNFNSPDSYQCSQDNRPDVVWDYTSPKHSKGSKKREIKITVEDFLKNLSNQQGSSNTASSQYITLLENWMTKQSATDVIKKPIRTRSDQNKRRSRRVIEEIKQFMESIQKKNEEKSKKEKMKDNLENDSSKQDILKNKKTIVEENSGNDSIDELWDDADNSFIVKATQQLEFACRDEVPEKESIFLSSIPETVCNTSSPSNNKSNFVETKTNLNNSDYQAQILLTQIINCEWNSDSDDNDWENAFIEDEALSLIPDDVLNGSQGCKKCDAPSTASENSKSMNCNSVITGKSALANSEEISFGCNSSGSANSFDIQMFNSFEDGTFGDEAILSKPEVLSMIDEVESKMSQSQRCTPEEIERKKDEAIQRRRRKSLRRRS